MLTWPAAIGASLSYCSEPCDKPRLSFQWCTTVPAFPDVQGVAKGGWGSTGAPSEMTSTGTGCGSIGRIGTTGIIIRCCQYAVAIPRCQKRGISNKSNVSWLTTKAPSTLSGGTVFIHIQRP